MTKQVSLGAIISLSNMIGWLQHYRNRRAIPEENVAVDSILHDLVVIRESIRKDYEAQNKEQA